MSPGSRSTHVPSIINGPAFPEALTTASVPVCWGFDPQGLASPDFACLQSSHLGPAGARLYHLIPDGSKPAANITTLKSRLALAPFRGQWAWPPTHRLRVLRTGTKNLLKPQARWEPSAPLPNWIITWLQALALPRGQTHHSTAAGRQHFSSQQGSSDAPGRQLAAKRHQKQPGNGLIGFIGLLPGPRSEIHPECICSAEVTWKKGSPKQALHCRGEIPVSFWFSREHKYFV